MYKHLFFDLDHTLWDFAVNEKITLNQLFEKHKLNRYFSSFDNFFDTYKPINKDLWLNYRNGNIPKETVKINRFLDTFRFVGLDDVKMAELIADEFVELSPLQTQLIPYTKEILTYLKPKYDLHIITNGFVEVQYIKLEKSGLRPYFKGIFVSEEIGYQKPDTNFFDCVVNGCGANKKECLVIGDNLEVDILGAKDYGLDQVYFNPDQTPHKEVVFKEITFLAELKDFL